MIVPFNASATENVVPSACPPTIVTLAILFSPNSCVLISIEFPSLDNVQFSKLNSFVVYTLLLEFLADLKISGNGTVIVPDELSNTFVNFCCFASNVPLNNNDSMLETSAILLLFIYKSVNPV